MGRERRRKVATNVRFADGSSLVVTQSDKLVAKEFANVGFQSSPTFVRLSNEKNHRVWINPAHVACFESREHSE